MDNNEDLSIDFQRYVLAYETVTNENKGYQNQLTTLDKEIQKAETLLQTFTQDHKETDEEFESVLNQLDLELGSAKEATSLLEEELAKEEKKYNDILVAIDEDKRHHEENKRKIEEEKILEKQNLVQEVEALKVELQTLISGNTDLQLGLVTKEGEVAKMKKDILKREENCNTLEATKTELTKKITSFKQSSKEDLARVERQQRLRIIDLNRRGYQLQTRLGDLTKKVA